MTTVLEHADLAAAAATDAHGAPAVQLLGTVSEIADQPPLITLCVATLALGLVARRPRLAGTGGAMLASVLVATALKSAVKHRVDRTRPRAVADGADYAMQPGSSHASDDNSFPSGHTAGAVAAARAVARSHPPATAAVCLAATGAALVQLPRGKHYPTDIAAGAVIGLLADAVVAMATTILARRLQGVGTGSAPV